MTLKCSPLSSLPLCSRSAEPVGPLLPPAALHRAGPRTQRQLPGQPFRRHPPAARRHGEEISESFICVEVCVRAAADRKKDVKTSPTLWV